MHDTTWYEKQKEKKRGGGGERRSSFNLWRMATPWLWASWMPPPYVWGGEKRKTKTKINTSSLLLIMCVRWFGVRKSISALYFRKSLWDSWIPCSKIVKIEPIFENLSLYPICDWVIPVSLVWSSYRDWCFYLYVHVKVSNFRGWDGNVSINFLERS